MTYHLYTLFNINCTYFRIVNLRFIPETKAINYIFLGSIKNFILTNRVFHSKELNNCIKRCLGYTNSTLKRVMEKDLCSLSEENICISDSSSEEGEIKTSTDSSSEEGEIKQTKPEHELRKYEEFLISSSGDNGHGVKLKVMNYNVLSQELLHRHRYLYKFQNDSMLNWRFRKQLLMNQIKAINPDILCIQEVEESELPHFYKTLESFGYNFVSKMKTRQKGDGLAIYYRSSDIKLKEVNTVEFRQPSIIELESRDNVGLIARLEKRGKEFIVANVHLLYNPKRTEVRLAQVQIMIAELHRLISKKKGKVGILLMGDFNSNPESAVINFITEGKLNSYYRPLPNSLGISASNVHIEEESKLYHTDKNNSQWDGHLESLQPSSGPSTNRISHPFKFSSVYNLTPNVHRGATTFQSEWIMVDYMFYTKEFELLSRLALPTPDECKEFIRYLPNNVNPSDHLPLIAEFKIL